MYHHLNPKDLTPITAYQIAAAEWHRYRNTELGKKSAEYDRINPHVWDLFKRFAQEVKQSGRKQYSAQSIIERIRWHVDTTTRGSDFKISNNCVAYYARKMMVMTGYEEFFVVRGDSGRLVGVKG